MKTLLLTAAILLATSLTANASPNYEGNKGWTATELEATVMECILDSSQIVFTNYEMEMLETTCFYNVIGNGEHVKVDHVRTYKVKRERYSERTSIPNVVVIF